MSDSVIQIDRGGSNRGRRVCVVGGGIGGLTAALAFARSGADVTVLEQAPEFREVGAGIQITPNGARALIALGLEPQLQELGLQAVAVQPVDALSGMAVTRFDLTSQSPAYRFYHRASLVAILGDAAQNAGATVRFGVRVEGVTPQGYVQTSEGSIEADIIAGADGIHSVLRSLTGHTATAEFTGQVAWRSVVSAKNIDPVASIWMAPKRHVVTYPLAEDVLNIVAVQERDTWAEEGWHHEDAPQNLRAAFADACPALQAILAHVERPRLWGLFRHPVAECWSRGNIALLGDAAHPTLPFLAQGANLAIEDAFLLSVACDRENDISTGLKTYEGLRKPRVKRAIEAANANAKNYHLSGVPRRVAHMGLKTLGALAPNAFIGRMDWLYGYDVTAE